MKKITMPKQNLDIDHARLLISKYAMDSSDAKILQDMIMYIEETVFPIYRLRELSPGAKSDVYDFMCNNDMPHNFSHIWFDENGQIIKGIR